MASHLAYSIPAKDRKKTLMRIPESHSLYVSPQSCARRQAIRAHKNGEADRSSFLQLTQADLVSGAYEGQVVGAVRELLRVLPHRPRVIQIFVNCVDDFLGTDNDALVEELREQFPDVRFSLSHINPIAVDLETDPMAKMQSGLYSLLEDPAERDAGVTVVGGFVPLPAASELHRALAAAGAGPARHVTACETFDEYLQLAQSSTVLSAGGMGDAMATAFSARFGMRRVTWHPTYALEEVDARYRELAAVLDAAGEAVDGEEADKAPGEAVSEAPAGAAGETVGDSSASVAGGTSAGKESDKAPGEAVSKVACETVDEDVANVDCDEPARPAPAPADSVSEIGGKAFSAMAPVLLPARAAAEAAVRRALAAVGSLPVAVDSSATFVPYNLAHELRDYGFNVRACFAFHMKGGDADAAQRLREDYPDVRIVNESADASLRAGSLAVPAPAVEGGGRGVSGVAGEGLGPAADVADAVCDASSSAPELPWVAIGQEAAFFTGARYVVDIYHDEGYFGYQGIERLMNELVDAAAGGPGSSDNAEVAGASAARGRQVIDLGLVGTGDAGGARTSVVRGHQTTDFGVDSFGESDTAKKGGA